MKRFFQIVLPVLGVDIILVCLWYLHKYRLTQDNAVEIIGIVIAGVIAVIGGIILKLYKSDDSKPINKQTAIGKNNNQTIINN